MKLPTKNLLRLLLLAQLLSPLPAQAFFGWGKFPSKMEAKEACDKWVKDGRFEDRKTYDYLTEEEKVSLRREVYFSTDEERKAFEDANLKWGEDGEPTTILEEDWTEKQRKIYEDYENSEIYLEFRRKIDKQHKEGIANLNLWESKWVTRNLPVRECVPEAETRQIIGKDGDKRKNFRY